MSLDIKRKKLELMRVETARHEQQFKIEEKLDEIKRLEEHIKIQMAHEEKLAKEIAELEKKEQ